MMKTQKINFCLSSFLYNNLQSYRDKALVIDTRDPEEYFTHSISGSINLSNEQIQTYIQQEPHILERPELALPKISELMTSKQLERFNQRRRLYCMLVISEASFPQELISQIKKAANADEFLDYFEVSQKVIHEDLEKGIGEMKEVGAVSLGLKLHSLFQQDRVGELYILVDGMDSFFNDYPFMDPTYVSSPNTFLRTKSMIASKVDATFNFPNDIYENRLFLGSFSQASQDAVIKSLGITHIMNVTAECSNVHEAKGIKYLHIVIQDETEVPMIKFFKEAYEFLDEILSSNKSNKILLHCAMGKSRSATIAVMFFMKKFSWTSDKALEYVKMKRRVVDPNYGFLKQLEEFEKQKYTFE